MSSLKRKRSQKAQSKPKKAKPAPKEEKKDLEKQYLAICNATMTVESKAGSVTMTVDSHLCQTSDIQPHRQRAINQAKGRAAEKITQRFFSEETTAGWNKHWDASRKMLEVELSIQTGLVPIKKLRLMIWLQEFVEGKLVGEPRVESRRCL